LNRNLYCGSRGTPGKTYSTIGGRVPEPNDSDLKDFPPFANLYGATHRQVLAVVAEALRHGGFQDETNGKRVGYYLCHASGGEQSARLSISTLVEETLGWIKKTPEFQTLPSDQRAAIEHAVVHEIHETHPKRQAGGSPFDTPGRGVDLVPRCFRWHGPVMAVDAACASSLQGLLLAALAIEQNQCEMAVVSAASRASLADQLVFSQAQALGETGSFPFDARADGFVNSDGYCAVVLQPLEQALAAGRCVLGVIRSIGASTDGRGRSLWAPRKEGQVLAIERAWDQGLDRTSLQYVEAHATSTKVGDAVELASLDETLGRCLAKGTRIPTTSVKANAGHTKEASGLTSLIKVLLAMKHECIPGARYFESPQEGVNWDASAFYVPAESLPWPEPAAGNPRRAGINAFGIGGLNLHVVVDQYSANAALPPGNPSSSVGREAAIIGRGGVFPGAHNIKAFGRLMASSASAIGPVPLERWNSALYCEPGGFRNWRSPISSGGFIADYIYDWTRHKVPPMQVRDADPLQFMLLDAAGQALEEAGLDKLDPARIAVVVGTTFGGEFAQQLNRSLFLPEFEVIFRDKWLASGAAIDNLDSAVEHFRELFLGDVRAIHDETGGFTSSTLASRIARTFNLMGGAFSLDSAEASSSVAIDAAISLLVAGRCDAVVCAGAERSLGISTYEELASRGVFERDFVPGEGAGVVVLTRTGDARRNQNKVFGVIRECTRTPWLASWATH
jgi:acyl transferase domain-containing protein